ncbi:ABC transporter permease [Rubeoparvulum massiliense]|uniref:ABC transporter permease n=1 Tax=Rubeoparvulum massiliense TaxID=1631346 RepID=UPI00065DC074|nr:ABC transporter permease [Rubeoparvulum massiliense]
MLGAMIKKDLLRILRDRKALLITLLMPIILISILGFSIGKVMGEQDIGIAKLAIINQDDGAGNMERLLQVIEQVPVEEEGLRTLKDQVKELPTQMDPTSILVNELLQNEELTTFIQVEEGLSLEEAKEHLSQGDLTAILVIPHDFTYHVWSNLLFPVQNQVRLTLYTDPDQSLKGGIIEEILTGYTQALSNLVWTKQITMEMGIRHGLGEQLQQLLPKVMENVSSQVGGEIQLLEQSVAKVKKISGFDYYAAGMAMMFILYSVGYGVQYTMEESRLHTYERLRIAGRSRGLLLTSRFFASLIFIYMQLIIIGLFSSLVLGVNWGSWFLYLVISLFAAFAVSALALLFSALALGRQNRGLIDLFDTIIIPLVSIVGGSFIPVQSLPTFLVKLSPYTLNGAGLQAYLKGMQGQQLTALQGELLVFLVTGGLFILMTMFVLWRREE